MSTKRLRYAIVVGIMAEVGLIIAALLGVPAHLLEPYFTAIAVVVVGLVISIPLLRRKA